MKNNYYRKIEGWFDFENFYDMIVEKFTSGIFLEIGVWQGKSIAYLAEKIEEAGTNVILFGIDTFQGTGDNMMKEAGMNSDQLYIKYCQNTAQFGNIKTYRGHSHNLPEMFADEYFDVIFIDGDHSYEAVKKDIELWYPKVKPGGIIAGHDYTEEYGYGVVKAVKEYFGDREVNILKPFVWYYNKPIE